MEKPDVNDERAEQSRKERRRSAAAAIVVLACAACLICAMSDGIKNNYGIMLSAIIESSGLTYASVSLVLAVGQLLYGVFQPVFGVLAQKRGSTPTLLLGVCLMLAGLLLLPQCTSAPALMFCLGALLPAGTGATSYGILIGAVTPRIPERTVSIVSGVVNASSGVGNALLSPIIQALLAAGGIAAAMLVLCIPTALMIPLCLIVGRVRVPGVAQDEEAGAAGAGAGAVGSGADAGDAITATGAGVGTEAARTAGVETASALAKSDGVRGPKARISLAGLARAAAAPFADAFQSRTYQLLMIGFFTCGFHMALISNHLPSQIVSYGISERTSALAFSVYGALTMVGSVASGALCGKLSMKNVLGAYYGLRSVISAVFLLAPKSVPAVFAYAVALGLTGAATVPPVSGIIGREFGAARVSALYGFVFFVHSIGSFLGAWLGGVFLDAFGGYALIWVLDIVLSAVAAAASWAIRDKTTPVR